MKPQNENHLSLQQQLTVLRVALHQIAVWEDGNDPDHRKSAWEARNALEHIGDARPLHHPKAAAEWISAVRTEELFRENELKLAFY